MPQPLTVSEIANMIGIEEAVIKHTLERHDTDLAVYLRDGKQSPPSEGDENGDISSAQFQPPLLDIEGLPLLITKLAFNIPTSDIIENLACQVLHLTLLQEENLNLTDQNRELHRQNEQLQDQIKELREKVETLQVQLAEQAEAASQRGFWKFFKHRSPKDS